MNWSGGYKNRFRTTSEIRKTAFQQQSRIILVDLVKHEVDHDKYQSTHIPGNKKQEFSPTSPTTDTSNDIPMQHCGTPFKNIPCGTSSDSEECEKDEISNTNYSPYSSDRETSDEHEVTISEGSIPICQSIAMVEEHFKNTVANLAVETQENSQSGCSSSRNSLISSSTPPPHYPIDDFHHSTQSLGFLTPIAYRRNAIVCSALGRQHELDSDLPYPATISEDKRAVIGNDSFFNTSVDTDNSEVPLQTTCSIPVPEDVIPAHEKQLNFYTPAQERITENRVAVMPEGSQTNVITTLTMNENCKKPVVNGAIVLRKHELRCSTHNNRTGECATPTPCANRSFHYPTPNLSCTTPIIRRENVVFSTTVGHQLATDDNFQLQNSPLSTSVNKESLIIPMNQSETDSFRDSSILRTPTQRDNDNSRKQTNRLMFSPIDATPAQRKQVRFASTVPLQKMQILINYKSTYEGISQTETASSSQSPVHDGCSSTSNLFEHHALISHPQKEEDEEIATTQGQTHHEEISAIYVTNSGHLPDKVQTILAGTSPDPCVEKKTRPISAIRKRKQPFALPSNTESSFGRKFKSGKSPRGRIHHCHCRTVIRKLKIRDAETQTSP